jgi:hypothetical protein
MTDRDRHRTQGYKTRAPEEPTPLPVDADIRQIHDMIHDAFKEGTELAASELAFNAGVEAERARAAQIAREEHIDAAWLAEDKAREERAAALATAREREAEAWDAFQVANRQLTVATQEHRAAASARQALEDAE